MRSDVRNQPPSLIYELLRFVQCHRPPELLSLDIPHACTSILVHEEDVVLMNVSSTKLCRRPRYEVKAVGVGNTDVGTAGVTHNWNPSTRMTAIVPSRAKQSTQPRKTPSS